VFGPPCGLCRQTKTGLAISQPRMGDADGRSGQVLEARAHGRLIRFSRSRLDLARVRVFVPDVGTSAV